MQVKTRRDLRDFIGFPYRRYRNHPYWVPPLRRDEWEQFDHRKNPFLDHADLELYVARDGSRTVGRVAAIEDHRHRAVHGERIACFGFFEANDGQAASRLLEAVERWAADRGHVRLRGPLNPSLNHTAGFQLDAFDESPFVLTPYSPLDYIEYLERLGYRKLKDLHAWRLDLSRPDHALLTRISRRVERQVPFQTRHLRMNAFDEEMALLLEIYSEAWADNWGFVPPTSREFESMAKKMKKILDPELVLVLEIDGEPAAFSVTLPDINQALAAVDGRLLPFGFLRLLRASKRISRVRMPLLGVRSRFRRKGLFAPLITRSIENARALGYTSGECSWTLEENRDIARAIQAAGAHRYKTYRIFQKDLA